MGRPKGSKNKSVKAEYEVTNAKITSGYSRPVKVKVPNNGNWTTSTSTTKIKKAYKGSKKPEMELLDQKQVFKKKTKLQQAEHDLLIVEMNNVKLTQQVTWLKWIAFGSFLYGLGMAVLAITL